MENPATREKICTKGKPIYCQAVLKLLTCKPSAPHNVCRSIWHIHNVAWVTATVSISMPTFTPPGGSFGFFRVTSSRCFGMSVAVRLRWDVGALACTLWLERGSVNAVQLECDGENLLPKCWGSYIILALLECRGSWHVRSKKHRTETADLSQ